MAKARTIFRRMRTLLWTALTLVTLLAAMLVGIGKLLMPYSAQYQPQLEAWLSREFKQDVVVDSFTGEWKAFGPRISLEGVTLLGSGQRNGLGDGEIAIQRAALDIKPINALLPNRPLYSFRIIGADLSLVRTPDGRYELSGLGVSGRNQGESGNSQLRNLTTVGEVRLEDSSLSFDDEQRDIHVQLTGMRGRLQLNGRELSTELEANISDEFKTRVLGDLKATLLLTLSEEQRLSKASWHMKTGELMIAELARQLPEHALIPRSGWLNAEIWGDWSKDSNQVMKGVIDLRESTLLGQPRTIQLDHLNTRFNWNFHGRKVWRVDLSDLTIETDGEQWDTDRMSIERNIPGNLGLWVSSDFIEVEFPMQLTQQIMNVYDSRWPRTMPRQARGQVREFDLVLDSRWKLFMVDGQMDTMDAWEWGKYPDVAGISGSLSLYGGEGEIQFSGKDVRLDWPRNFRRHAIVNIPQCSFEILWGDAWRIDSRNCLVQNENIELSGRARLAGNEGKPEVDINVNFDLGNLAELDDYWPQSLMSAKVIDWLSNGISAGRASGGRFIMRGDIDDWPFRENNGILLATASVDNSELDYYDGWPIAQNVDMAVQFRGTSMEAEGSVGNLGGVPVQQASVSMEDFKAPVMVFDYQAQSPMPVLVSFLERSPIMENIDLDLNQFRFEHEAGISGKLVAPLRAELGELSIDGTLNLEANSFTELRSGIELHGLNGEVSYDRHGLSGSQLSGLYLGHATALSLQADWDGEEVFRADMSGNFPVEALIPGPMLEAEPMLRQISGSSNWDISLSVNRQDEMEPQTWLDMRSALQGVGMSYPAPLDKPVEESWPIHVRYPVNSPQPVLSINVIDVAALQFELGGELGAPTRANVHFGSGMGELPSKGLISIDGKAGVFDMDRWMDHVIERFSRESESAALKFDKGMLVADEMLFLNRSFSDVTLSLGYSDNVMTGEIDSSAMAGSIRYNRSDDGSHSLTAEMDRLFMPPPIDQGMTMDTDPSELPEMHLYAKQFSYLSLELGETRIEAFPLHNGLRIESVEAESPQLNFQARGDWLMDDAGSSSDFDIMITSESLGSVMEMMDISSVLEGGQTVLQYDASWPGPPAAFALAHLQGEIKISVVGGKILNADAGAGRMVGLLSIAALPRRLALDFRDVFGSGFSFDVASGTVTLKDGAAHTEDLVLESTAATMSIKGSSDLVEQEFDYVMTVRPGVSQTLPTLGAVIGGPGGAAAGLALQGLLRNSLGDATEATYTIRGPWRAPTVEPVKTSTSTSTGGETGK